VGQAAHRPSHPGAPERLLPASHGEKLPARKFVPDLPDVRDNGGVPPQHHAQRKTTLQIISSAEAAGHGRVAEMNRQVAANLDSIITALEADDDTKEASASAS